MTADLAAVPEEDDGGLPVAEEDPPVALIESDPDAADTLAPFQVAYRRDGKRIVEDFEARRNAPFAIFRRFDDLDRASEERTAGAINQAVARLFGVALTEASAKRLLTLIEGDEEQVGAITSDAIYGVVRFLRGLHYASSPTQPGSSSGGSRTPSGSSAGRSGKKSTSKPSQRKRA